MSSDAIRQSLAADRFAVAGASPNRAKFGNKVLRKYQQHGREVVAVHPLEQEVEGAPAYRDLGSIPEPPQAVSIVTPPQVTERLVDEALQLGIRLLGMQPGAESAAAIQRAEAAGATVIHGGPCVLVELG